MTSRVFTVPLISTDGASSSPVSLHSPAPRFRHFIAGPENQLLRCLVDTARPGEHSFPLITLSGPTGVGKSHLLHGLVERYRQQSPDAEIISTTGADFARSFARAVDVDSVSEWRDRQRSARLFVLDDVHEIANKTAAQTELVATLDALAEKNAQVVIAVPTAPFEWGWMIAALRSRLQGGLVLPIANPSATTSEYIVRELCDEFGATMDGVSSFENRPQTYPQLRALVLRSLHDQKGASERSETLTAKPCIPKIAKAVAKHFHVRLADLVGPSRRQSVVSARGVAIYLARTLLNLSLDEIGSHFGGRDHTTILHAWRKTTQRIKTNAVLRNDVEKLTRALSVNFEIQSTES